MTAAGFQDAFDLTRGLDFQQDRAHWLGICSELVYPVTEQEKEAERKASKAKAIARALGSPWWKPWQKKTNSADYEQARDQALAAAKLVTRTEALRIECDVNDWGLDRFQFISGISTQCFIAASDTVIIICFRGTEPNRPWDIYDDLMAIPIRHPSIPGLIHVGFWSALKQVWRDVDSPSLVWPPDQPGTSFDGLRECLEKFRNDSNPQLVWITGHSLGGGLATMAAARLVGDGVLTPEEIGGVYTFGQPRVGDQQFVEGYALQDRHFRVVHNNDVVTRVPPESIRHALSAVKLFIDLQPGVADKIHRLSSLEYHHVGQLAFLNDAAECALDLNAFELFRLRGVARFNSLLHSDSLLERLAPDITDHSMSRYNNALATSQFSTMLDSDSGRSTLPGCSGGSVADHSDSFSPAAPEPETAGANSIFLAVFSGAGVGLLVGLLVALSVSPTVGLMIGGLASSLALFLGLNDRHFTQTKAIRIGTFGFVCVAGVLLGTYIRSHELLSPSLESEFTRYTDKKLGFTEAEAREILKFTRELVAVPGALNNSGQGKKSSNLFGAEFKANDCNEVDNSDGTKLRVTLSNFRFQGGVWKDLADSMVSHINEAHQLEMLLAVKSAVCEPEPAQITDTECTLLSRFSPNDNIDAIRNAIRADGKVFLGLSQNLPESMPPVQQTKALLAVRDVFCQEGK